jgi:methylthioribulose-1-phosphate dehydratase
MNVASRATDDQLESAALGVLALAHHAGAKQWVPATSGNFSARVDASSCAITTSGGDKGRLTRDRIVAAALVGGHPRQSAEAPLHYLLYRLAPTIGAVAHVHAMSSVLASMVDRSQQRVRLEGLELLKAFHGITTHEACLDVPIFPNDQDLEGLARQVEHRLAADGLGYGFLLAGHGLYAWGRDAAETIRHLDAFEYLFTLMLKLRGIPA